MELPERLIDKVKNYKPPADKLRDLADVPIVFLVGISGAGKNAITHRLLDQYPNEFKRFITHTTRKPRMNHGIMEQNGAEYYFIDFETSEKMLDDHQYIEANLYSGNIYGTSIQEIQQAHDEHKKLIGDIDVNGVSNFKQVLPGCKPVFILPPDFQTWQKRFLTRYQDEVDKTDWHRRINTAYHEINHVMVSDHYYLIVNDDLDEAVSLVRRIANGENVDPRPPHALGAANQILMQLHTILQS